MAAVEVVTTDAGRCRQRGVDILMAPPGITVRGRRMNWIQGSSYFCDSRYHVALGLAHKLTVSSARFGRVA